MRRWQIGEATGIESLRLVAAVPPVPGPGEVLVRVRAAALNHRDLMIVSGRYHSTKPPGRVPLGDGMGKVAAVGADVTGWPVGTRVSSVHFLRWIDGRFPGDAFVEDLGATRDGWLADYIVLPAAALVAVPDAVGDADAASLPAAGVTAWAALHDFGRITRGDTVLMIGTGGVSAMALRIARSAGARTVLLSTSAAKLERAAAAGMAADETIDTSAITDWPAEVIRRTGGADIVVETVGTATLARSIAASAVGGRIAFIGALGGNEPPRLDGLIAKTISIKGIASGSRAMLAALLDQVAREQPPSVVCKTFPFVQALAAYRALSAGEHLGKIVINCCETATQ